MEEKPNDKAGNKAGPKEGMLTVSQYKDRIQRRMFRTLDYVTIAFSMLAIYSSIFAAEYLLLVVIEHFMHDEIANSPLLETLFNGIKKGLAFLTVFLAGIHGIKAAYEQYRLDERLAKEDEKPHV